mmetsp:Transcript_28979/g.52050  ORF Transcript_28979/g.52050 Transcript_28979/m.52050 type:complete len:234 (+) Transcript_28979:1489-2190(+)
MNTRVFATHPIVSQVWCMLGMTFGLIHRTPLSEKSSARVTVAKIPDPCKPVPSVIQKHNHAAASVRPISKCGCSQIMLSARVRTMAKISPMAMLLRHSRLNMSMIFPALGVGTVASWAWTKLKKMKKRTEADPSLSRASPSMRRLKCSGAPRLCRRETTATGSVALAIDENMNVSVQLQPYASPTTGLIRRDVMTTATQTPPKAMSDEDGSCFFRTKELSSRPGMKSSGGMNV